MAKQQPKPLSSLVNQPPRITRKCAGGCGRDIFYILDENGGQSRYAPVYTLQGHGVQYAGGHLCIECDLIVCDALRDRKVQ